MKQTLYDILGVAQDASFEDIELAYSARFEALKTETSWESNRFVLLNEAHEVLTDPNRRAAYDYSLVTPAPPRARMRSAVSDDEPRTFVKWIVFGTLMAATAIWWSMPDDAPPAQPTATSDAPTEQVQEELQSIPEESPTANAQEEAVTPEVVANEAPEISATPVPEVAAPVAAIVSPIVGNWDCFDPVTGRTSQYRFNADGQLALQQSGNEEQNFKYEITNGQVRFVDVDPSRTMSIEELTTQKLILNSAEEGRPVVCSR